MTRYDVMSVNGHIVEMLIESDYKPTVVGLWDNESQMWLTRAMLCREMRKCIRNKGYKLCLYSPMVLDTLYPPKKECWYGEF